MKRRPRVPPPVPPSGAIATYAKAIREIEREVDAGIRAVFERETGVRFDGPADGGYPSLDSDVVRRIVQAITRLARRAIRRTDLVRVLRTVAERTDQNAARNLARQLETAGVQGIAIPTAGKEEFASIVDVFRDDQLRLIQSLSFEKVQRVRKVLDANRGARVEDVAKRIRIETGAERSKAQLIARDQVLKLNASVTWMKHTAAGITEYEWSTSGDERVRPGHRRLDGKRFKYANPPVVDESGRTAHPGQDYRCRCVALLLIPGVD